MEKSHKYLLFDRIKEDELTNLLLKFLQSFQGELKKMRLEMGSPKEVGSREESRFSHGECVHAATQHDAQHSQVPISILRWMGGGRIPKRRTLSDFL